MKDAIKGFWGDFLGTEHPYNLKALDELLDNHPFCFPNSENHTVDLLKVEKLLLQANHTSAGPDGIPFSLYQKTNKKYQEMWVELIQQAGESLKFPNSFGESQLCLILKIKNIPHPDQFRPISVTNSDYQIVMGYCALWFSEIASGVISDTQHAMFKMQL